MVSTDIVAMAADDYCEEIIRYLYAVESYAANWSDLFWELFCVMATSKTGNPSPAAARRLFDEVIDKLLAGGAIRYFKKSGASWYQLTASTWLKLQRSRSSS